jgi:hypothetical protein
MPPALISHTFLRLRGQQNASLTVHHARTDIARVTLAWGNVLMSFLNAQAAQGVLEGFAAARPTVLSLPAQLPAQAADPYDQPAIAIDWTRRPGYAVTARDRQSADQRRSHHWTDLYMGPVTFQILDLLAYRSSLTLLGEAHRTAIAVCLDGDQHDADPAADDYRPLQ